MILAIKQLDRPHILLRPVLRLQLSVPLQLPRHRGRRNRGKQRNQKQHNHQRQQQVPVFRRVLYRSLPVDPLPSPSRRPAACPRYCDVSGSRWVLLLVKSVTSTDVAPIAPTL